MRSVVFLVLALALGACAGQSAPTTLHGERRVPAAQTVAYAPDRAFRPESTWITPAAGYREGENVLIVTGDAVEHHFVAAGKFQPGIGYRATAVSSVALGGRVGRVRGYVSEGDERLLLVFLCSGTDRLDDVCTGSVVELRFESRRALDTIRHRLIGGPRPGGLQGTVVLFAPSGRDVSAAR